MERLSREQTLADTAVIWARRSTCSRLSVGCVINRDGRILVQGYNGAPSGLPHCDHRCDCLRMAGNPAEFGHLENCAAGPVHCRAVHAEQNAIAWAAREGVPLKGADLVVTHQPCLSCARSIINAGIVSVTFGEEYRLPEGLDLLHEAGLTVVHRPTQNDRIVP